MGKVFFLNQKSKEYHEQMGIKVKNPPELKVIQGAVIEKATSRKKTSSKKAPKAKRQTMGQRIFESLQDRDPKGVS